MFFSVKKIHKTLGVIMLLPFIAWAITGVFFFIKPGYSDAYHQLSIKTYSNIPSLKLPNNNAWQEVKMFRSILGNHLLVKTEEGWKQLNEVSFSVQPLPDKKQIKRLINDAIQQNKERYGEISAIDNLTITTSSEIDITLNWQNMTLSQKGPDTHFINTMYKIHYLQWTGIKVVDKFLGVIGLALVVILALLGISLMFRRSSSI